MTNEEKDLLFKDLCGRVPHNTLVQARVNDVMTEMFILHGITNNGVEVYTLEYHAVKTRYFNIEDIKPYLRPLYSMTDDEMTDYNMIKCSIGSDADYVKIIDWFNENHFDYRGLIEKGLALEATEEMYNKKLKQ